MSTIDDRPTLLLVDDDRSFCRLMKRALEQRGFAITVAHNVEDGLWAASEIVPEYAIIDLSMPGKSGLTLVDKLAGLGENTAIIVLTGYASVATAVEAIKRGATHYLAKPAKPDDVIAAFRRSVGDPDTPIESDPLSVNRLEWEHIQKVLWDNEGNITLTAEQLGMHRRTLQRKLNKRPAPER